MRFKNRYILLQLVWKDGKRDDSLSKPAASRAGSLPMKLGTHVRLSHVRPDMSCTLQPKASCCSTYVTACN